MPSKNMVVFFLLAVARVVCCCEGVLLKLVVVSSLYKVRLMILGNGRDVGSVATAEDNGG